nr:RNA-directed DNA polymerase, eukaryota, reverse transcriptase zinc-binding domain protein [Tanacetum cinerariifolium]
KKRTNVEQSASGGDPLFLTPLNSNQSGNEAMENVAHEGISSLGTIESVPKNMSPGAFCGNMLFEFATSSARGRSGGILCVWDKTVFQKRRIYCTGQCLSVEGKWLANNSDLLFMSVYSPQDMPHKRQLWAYMTGIINHWHGEVVIMGDFNEVRFASERHGFTLCASNPAKFNTFITNSHLIDVPLGGYSFMWSDKHERVFLTTCQIVQRTFLDIGVIDRNIFVDMTHKAKGEWAIKGDENSKFFHSIVNKKDASKPSKAFFSIGEWIDNPDRVKREFYNHFANRFSAPVWSRVLMEGIFPRCLGDDSSHDLEGDIYVDEIKRRFGIVGTKILDGPLILNEIVSWCKSRNEQVLLFKVDFQKAFDSIRWDYLDDILGVHSSDIQSMDDSFGCLTNNLLFTYIGVKVDANMGRINSWNWVIQKVRIKLSKWKFKSLSVGGLWLNIIKLLTVLMALLISLPRHVPVVLFRSRFIKQPLVLNLRAWILWGSAKKVILNGNNSNFLYNKWLGDVCFKMKFNRMFNLDLQRMLQLRKSFKIQTLWFLFEDVLETLNGHGDFSVKSAKEEIDKHFLVTSSSSTRWSKLLHVKLNVFAWRMFLDKIPTMINLFNTGLDVPCVLCSNCGNAVESRNHLLFGCSMALNLFWLVVRWWNIDIINLIDPLTWESWFNGLRLNNLQKLALEASFFSMWWHIWKYRNPVMFALKMSHPHKERHTYLKYKS